MNISKFKAAAPILIFALLFTGFYFADPASAQVIVVGKTPTPKPTITIIPKPTVVPNATPTPTPTVTPTPVATPTPAIQTLGDLQAKIRASLLRPEAQRGRIGIKIVSLDTGKVLFEDSAEKYFMPASNMKVFTIAAALDKLTPNFKFLTSVYAGAMPDSAGTIKGNLTIYGRGDISMALSFIRPDITVDTAIVNGDYLRVVEPLADKIVQAGIKRIEGDLVGDESYFTSNALPPTWEWDDLQAYYGAEVTALPVLDNSVDVSIRPSSKGMPCVVQILPVNTLYTVVNRCATSAAGTRQNLQIEKKLDQNIFEVNGTMPVGDRGYRNSIAVSRPAKLFVELLRQALMQKGVTITGQNRVMNSKEKLPFMAASSTPWVEVTKLESPPFSVIAAKTMKPSQNLYTETILRALGEQMGDKSSGKASDAKGIDVVQKFLVEAGVQAGSIVQYDGSGLSRHDLITPAATVQVYVYMAGKPYAQAWRDAQAIAGVDGTLSNRFRGTAAAGNARGKTGTIDQVSSLSGYVTTASGERLVFSVLTNNIPGTSGNRTRIMDEIVVALASFTGKSN